MRHSIDLICARRGEEEFAALGSPCDRRLVVSARYCDTKRFRLHHENQVGVTFEYTFFLARGTETEVEVKAVAESLADKTKVYTLALGDDYSKEKTLRAGGGGTTTMTGDLPAEAPAGRYRVRLEFSAEGKSWGGSRSFEAVLK